MTPTESITLGLALVLLSTVRFSAHSNSQTGAILIMLALLAVALVVLHQWVPEPCHGSRSARPIARQRSSGQRQSNFRLKTLVEEVLQPRTPPFAAVPVVAPLVVVIIVIVVASMLATPGLLRWRRRCVGLDPSAHR